MTDKTEIAIIHKLKRTTDPSTPPHLAKCINIETFRYLFRAVMPAPLGRLLARLVSCAQASLIWKCYLSFWSGWGERERGWQGTRVVLWSKRPPGKDGQMYLYSKGFHSINCPLLQTAIHLTLPPRTWVSEHRRWGSPGHTQVIRKPKDTPFLSRSWENFQSKHLMIIKWLMKQSFLQVVQNFWWEASASVASLRISSAAWLSRGQSERLSFASFY